MGLADDIINTKKKNESLAGEHIELTQNQKKLVDKIINSSKYDDQKERMNVKNANSESGISYTSTPYKLEQSKEIKKGAQTKYNAPIFSTNQSNVLNPNTISMKDISDRSSDLKWYEKQNQGKKKSKGNDAGLGLLKSALALGNYIGQGVLKAGETALDTALQIGTSKWNPYYIFNPDELESHQQIAKEIIQENGVENLVNTLSGNKNFNKNVLDKGSLIKSDNIGGQVAQGIGNMLPSILIGNTGAGNIGSTISLGANAYGGGVEEAYNDGANRKQANLYGLGSAGLEMATEWITGGIPGVKSLEKIGLDSITEKGLKKISNQVTKEVLRAGYKMAGEGLEEGLSEYFNSYLKEFIYAGNKGDSIGTKISNAHNNVDWNGVMQSALSGAITGGILEAPMNVYNIRNGIVRQNQINSNNNQIVNLQNQQNASLSSQRNDIINEQISNLEQQNNILRGNEPVNPKIANFQESAKQYFDDSVKSKNFQKIAEKLITEKGYNIILDDSLNNGTGNFVNAQINTLENGETEIRINPNSPKAGEFLLVHEITHSIETDSMKKLILDYASKHDDFNQSLESLKKTYNTEDVSSEVIADISGELFGNQEFINNLSIEQPNIFKRLYNKIVEFANRLTGNAHEALFVRDLKQKWGNAYRENSNQLNNSKFSIQTDENGNRYVNVDTDQNIFDGISPKDYSKIAKMYINDYLRGETKLANNDSAIIDSKATNKYTNPGKKQPNFIEKMKLTPELKNILEISQKSSIGLPTKDTSKYGKWEYYNFNFKIGNQSFNGKVNIGIDSKGRKHFYEVNNIKKTSGISDVSPNRPTGFSKNNIPQSNNNVKPGTLPKYSMSENINNTQELNNSSFFLKQRQNEIIQKFNPVDDTNSYHTWIRSAKDICTFEETLLNPDYKEYFEAGEDFDESYTAKMAQKALDTGKIIVYSSYPIEQGIFVSPSRMEAESYSGNGKVYSKEVNLTDVAWIDPTQGQYAKVNTKYSQNNSKWQQYLDSHYKNNGIKTYFKDIKESNIGDNIFPKDSQNTEIQKEQLPISDSSSKNYKNEIISDINTLKAKARNISKELNNKESLDIPRGKELRRWSETSTSSKLLKDFVAIEDLDVDKITYTPISNKKTLENAQKKVSSMTYEEGLNYVNAKMNDSKVDLTDLAVIDQLLVQAKQKGDYKTATDLIMNKTILGTELGQMVQQFSMIGRTTPEGQLQMYQKIIKRAKATGDKSFEGVEITPKMVETVLKTYKNDGTYTQEDLDANMEVFKKQIVEQMKSTTADKINGWRYLSMLGNPKTHIRNIVSNVAMSGTMKVKNAMAKTLESVFIHDKSKRTRTWKSASEDVKNFAKKNAIELKSVIQGESKYGTSTQLKMEKEIFKKGIATKGVEKVVSAVRGKNTNFNNGILESISNLNSKALSVEDWVFSKNAYINNLQEYLTAKGITTQEQINSNKELVEQAKLYAIEQAEIATFRQYSKIASYISKIENINGASKVAVGAMLPFKKTPVNVAKTGVNYSLLGLVKTIGYDTVQLKNGNMNASQYIDNMSQGLTGTSLMLLGYTLAKAGFVTGDSDDNKEEKYDSQLGNQGYALKLGNKTYSLSWLSPVAMPFLMGANAYDKFENKEGWDANIVIDTLAKTMDPISEMSFISGLTDALSSYKQGSMQMLSDMAQNTISNYSLQFIPTLFSQIAGTFDDKVRSTSADRTSSFEFGNKLMKQAMYKIPGLRNQLPVATDIWGNDKKQSDNIVERAYRNFLSPYTKKEITETSLDKELKKVYRDTGNTSVIPGIPQGYLTYKDQNYNMNSREYTQFKKTYGNTAYKVLNDIIKSDSYKTSEVKENMIEDAYIYARELAKKDYFKSKGIKYESKNQKWVQEIENKIAPDKYISFKKNDIDLIKGDKDDNGNTIKGTSTGKKAYKIVNNNLLSDSEKDFLLSDITTSENPVSLSTLKKLKNNEDVFKYYYGLSKKDTFDNIVIKGNINQEIYIDVKKYISDVKTKYDNSQQRRQLIFQYIQNKNVSKNQKIMMYGMSGYGISDYKNDMFQYINSLKLSKSEKEEIYYYLYSKKESD